MWGVWLFTFAERFKKNYFDKYTNKICIEFSVRKMWENDRTNYFQTSISPKNEFSGDIRRDSFDRACPQVSKKSIPNNSFIHFFII